MDLKNFISESLYQIIAGIRAAQDKVKELEREGESKPSTPYIVPQPGLESEDKLHDVYFDVAFTVLEEETGASCARLSVMGLSMMGKGSFEQIDSFVSRVKFSVPVSYPSMTKEFYVPKQFKSWHLNNAH